MTCQMRARFCVVCAGVALCLAGNVAAADQKKADPVLDRTLPEVNLTDVTVQDVVDFLQDVSGTKIDWKAMEEAGIDPKTGVTFRVQKMKFGKAVKRLFVIAGADAEPEVTHDKGKVVVKPAPAKK
jgi:hypothetical protein